MKEEKCLVAIGTRPDSPTSFDVHEGMIENKRATNIAIDSLCSMSQIHPNWVHPNVPRQGFSKIKGINGDSNRELVQVILRVKGKTFTQLMAISPTMSFDAILGLDVPHV